MPVINITGLGNWRMTGIQWPSVDDCLVALNASHYVADIMTITASTASMQAVQGTSLSSVVREGQKRCQSEVRNVAQHVPLHRVATAPATIVTLHIS